jgi:hypothetical protein
MNKNILVKSIAAVGLLFTLQATATADTISITATEVSPTATSRIAPPATTAPARPLTTQQYIDNEQANQGQLIANGIANGSLTTDEVKKLRAEQAMIITLETRFRPNGYSNYETVTMKDKLSTARKNIITMLNNNVRNPNARAERKERDERSTREDRIVR